ncbi:MAG: hypothetical protein JOY82_17045 [Streptosporangiaceae bacterium]|nr:hypothetical protein [Streptosporangiaceae bacterium]
MSAIRGADVRAADVRAAVAAVLARLFPWRRPDPGPWEALLHANGRIDLPGLPRLKRWRWHCAPLAEWNGPQPLISP